MQLGGNAIFNVAVYEATYGKIETAEVRPIPEFEVIPYKKKPSYLRKQNILGKELIAIGIIAVACSPIVLEMAAIGIVVIVTGTVVMKTKSNIIGGSNE